MKYLLIVLFALCLCSCEQHHHQSTAHHKQHNNVFVTSYVYNDMYYYMYHLNDRSSAPSYYYRSATPVTSLSSVQPFPIASAPKEIQPELEAVEQLPEPETVEQLNDQITEQLEFDFGPEPEAVSADMPSDTSTDATADVSDSGSADSGGGDSGGGGGE